MTTAAPIQSTTTHGSVFNALFDDPADSREAELNSNLLSAINERLDALGWDQTTAAKKLGVTQPRVSDIRRGKLSRFTTNSLMKIAAPLGISLTVVQN